MYKLMIVEDEDIIRTGLREIIPWEQLGFVVAGEADNGKSAVELIPLIKPDVILSDIRMPGMDGIALMSELKEYNPEIEVVVLSGYDDFEYARKCIEFGVVEYLLKPINNENIISTFSKLRARLDSKLAKSLEYDSIKKKTEITVSIVREKMIWDILENRLNSDGPDNIDSILDYLYRNSESFGISLLQINIDEKDPFYIDNINKDIRKITGQTIAIFPDLELLETLFVKELNAAVLVLCGRGTGSGAAAVDLCHMVKLDIEKHIKSKYLRSVSISAGIGLFYQNIYELHISYTQAKTALERKFFSGKGKVIEYGEFSGIADTNRKNGPFEESKLINRINESALSCDAISLEKNIHTYFDMLADTFSDKTNMIFMKLIEMIMSLSVRLEEKGIEFNNVNNREIDGRIRFLLSNGTREELENWLLEFYRDIVRNINTAGDRRSCDLIIENAKNYIHQNYDKKISRKELSDFVFTSPSYFFDLFKQKTGYTFIEYITMVRINKAKELLAKSDYKVYEVAIMVGYDDFRHFSKVFKKVENISPTEYRECNLEKLKLSL